MPAAPGCRSRGGTSFATVTSKALGASPVAAPPCEVFNVNSMTGTGAPAGMEAESIVATRVPMALICSSVSALPLPMTTGPPASMLGGGRRPCGTDTPARAGRARGSGRSGPAIIACTTGNTDCGHCHQSEERHA